MKITIPGEFTDLNTYIRAERTPRVGHLLASKIKHEETDRLAYTQGKVHRLTTVHFTWICKNKKKDPDNIAFAKKFILDGLVKAGVLENDGWKHIKGFTDMFKVDKDNPRVEVWLEEEI